MKKSGRIIAVMLVLVMALSGMAVFAGASSHPFASSGNIVKTTLPTIVIYGQGNALYAADGTQIYDFDVPTDYIKEQAKELIPLFEKGLITGKYTEWAEAFTAVMADVYKDVALDKNGEVTDGSYADASSLSDSHFNNIANKHKNGKKYGINDIPLSFDWRLDPFYNASLLNDYIGKIKAATGAPQVNIIARCEGCAILACYINEYGSADINSANLYFSTLGGVEAVSSIFSGNIVLDEDAISDFYYCRNDYIDNIGDEALVELINCLYDYMYSSNGVKRTVNIIKPIMGKLYAQGLTGAIRVSYGSMPGIWTLVTPEEYEAAREGVFGGMEEEYAGMLEKIDRYHNEISVRYKEIFKLAEENGTVVNVFAKYDDSVQIPVTDNSYINDATVTLTNTSLGATTAARGTVFSDEYLAEAEKNGTSKYIAADKMVDASTCTFRDTTWFIYNCEHRQCPYAANNMIMTIAESSGKINVFSDPDMQQFLCLEVSENATDKHAGELVPLTEENCMQPTEKDEKVHSVRTRFQRLIAFIKSVFAMLKNLIKR